MGAAPTYRYALSEVYKLIRAQPCFKDNAGSSIRKAMRDCLATYLGGCFTRRRFIHPTWPNKHKYLGSAEQPYHNECIRIVRASNRFICDVCEMLQFSCPICQSVDPAHEPRNEYGYAARWLLLGVEDRTIICGGCVRSANKAPRVFDQQGELEFLLRRLKLETKRTKNAQHA